MRKSELEYKRGLALDLNLPDCGCFDLFVYFHGGGLVGGTKSDADAFAPELALRGIATASVRYRLYPEACYPDFINDCAEAVAFLLDVISDYGDCRRVFLGGSSAGGYISMMLCFDRRYLDAAGVDRGRIDGYIHDAGQPTAHFNVLKEHGVDPRRVIVDERAPMFYVGTEEDYPPMLFLVSDNDMFGRLEQTNLMVNALAHFGHTDKVALKVLVGKHCAHTKGLDADGKSIFARIVGDYIQGL